MVDRHKVVLMIVLFMLSPTLSAGCTSPTIPVPTTAAPTTTPTVTSTTAVSQGLAGTHVRVLGLWSGPELDSFIAVKAAWKMNDTPAACSFMTYLAGAQAQEAWIKLDGFTSVNRSVSLDTYPDPVARAMAKELTEARISRFGAGDMMPVSLQRAWWRVMLELVQDPGKLDSFLNSLTSVAQGAK